MGGGEVNEDDASVKVENLYYNRCGAAERNLLFLFSDKSLNVLPILC